MEDISTASKGASIILVCDNRPKNELVRSDKKDTLRKEWSLYEVRVISLLQGHSLDSISPWISTGHGKTNHKAVPEYSWLCPTVVERDKVTSSFPSRCNRFPFPLATSSKSYFFSPQLNCPMSGPEGRRSKCTYLIYESSPSMLTWVPQVRFLHR